MTLIDSGQKSSGRPSVISCDLCGDLVKVAVHGRIRTRCRRCYIRVYQRSWQAKHRIPIDERPRLGAPCRCGCGQICRRRRDSLIINHVRKCACGCDRTTKKGREYTSGHWMRSGRYPGKSPEGKAKLSAAHKGKPKSAQTRMKMSRSARKSEFSMHERHDLIRKWAIYREWRGAVFERDNYQCVLCGARNGNGHRVILEADHIRPFAERPDLIFTVSNGRTLCRPCHKRTSSWGRRPKTVNPQLPLEMLL